VNFKTPLPGGIHYGEKLRVYEGRYIKIVDKFAYFDNTYFLLDLNYVSVNEFVNNKKYFIFLTLYNHQWRIFDYICC